MQRQHIVAQPCQLACLIAEAEQGQLTYASPVFLISSNMFVLSYKGACS